MRLTHARFFCIAACTALAVPFFALAEVSPAERATLETQLAQIQSEIKDNQANLSQLQTQRTSLERDVAIFDSKIQAAQLGIKQRNLIIEKLKDDIAQKQQGIRNLDYKVAAKRRSRNSSKRRKTCCSCRYCSKTH